MKRRAGSSKHDQGREVRSPSDLLGAQDRVQESETCPDIVLAARALGFSREELFEIRRLYQPMPGGSMK